MTLDELKAQFTGLMNRRDLTANTALVSTFMNQAIMRVQRDLRVPAMEKMAQVTIGDGYTGLAIPSDLLELKEIRPEASNVRLRKTTLDQALSAATTNGVPQIYARRGSSWVLGPSPSSGDLIDVTYYAELPALVADTDENVISIIAWDLIVAAACSAACAWFKDNRRGSTVDPLSGKIIDGFEGDYNRILNALQDQADQDELGDDACVAPCLVYPPDDFIDYEVVF
jgi:hypothetical protein